MPFSKGQLSLHLFRAMQQKSNELQTLIYSISRSYIWFTVIAGVTVGVVLLLFSFMVGKEGELFFYYLVVTGIVSILFSLGYMVFAYFKKKR